ncbi:hypothetical protein FHR81_000188 [Actinoalloteichus hoggarensis]|uniref:Uncharacterized protein n=1 Tax=Actinoalloteichus hoggarensis TaxID=1470176 RepID=A0A221W2V6_9PSEU|nr:hypothetical protein [Actinoalloteichus hoggarensis]ASO20128.1 hypothetical protein AHOG_12425 [Actinoalloteichus hoggarensis]MBB5919159.1 hypothetical protein [Actinoalloteichus hoggarensis]
MTGSEPSQPAGNEADLAEQEREVADLDVGSGVEEGEDLPLDTAAELPAEAAEADVVEQREELLDDEEATEHD